jgi:hypothetical protein
MLFIKRLIAKICARKNKPVDNVPEIISQNTAVEKNDWELESSATSDKVLKVKYQEKYGAEKTVYCMAVFYNSKTRVYKLDAPWFQSVTLEQENLVSKDIVLINKTEMPQG